MDWKNLQPDVYMRVAAGFTKGRPYGISGVTVHHMAGNLTLEQCKAALDSNGTGAHYGVAGGRVAQFVDDYNRAWACGDGIGTGGGNDRTISIEHANDHADPWTVSEDTLDTGAHLTAAICVYYKLGRPEWGKNVWPHRHWSATACPGELYGSQKDSYIARAQAWYDSMVNGAAEPEKASQGASQANAGASTKTENFGGRYRCTVSKLNVRTSPSLSGSVVASYGLGQTVVLDDWYKSADGYIWGRYTGYSGNVRYVAVGRATGKPEADDYLIKE
jgi:hypothetical protein